MKLLLDTHIWIWSVSTVTQLSRGVQQELSDPNNEVWLSPISLWEALLLQAKDRIELPSNSPEWLVRAALLFREAPLTHEIVAAARQLPFDHGDPADRFLAATARVLGLTLVTADRRLLGLGAIATLANR
ncbi:MAG TPA: type II toxin-antitoxin system VapC family toxin [Candidatus Acidoferrales bacterium]